MLVVSRNDSGPRPLTTPRTLELSFNGSDFDFDQTISWKSRDADRGSRRWIVFEKCCVNFIHPREVRHGLEIHDTANNLIHARSCGLEDGGGVEQNAFALRRDVAVD